MWNTERGTQPKGKAKKCPRREKNKRSVLNTQGEEDPRAQICRGKQPRWDYAPFFMTFHTGFFSRRQPLVSWASSLAKYFTSSVSHFWKKLKVSRKCFAIAGADRKSQKQLTGVGKGSSSVVENLSYMHKVLDSNPRNTRKKVTSYQLKAVWKAERRSFVLCSSWHWTF